MSARHKGKAKKLAALYRAANPSAWHCPKCRAGLKVRCVRQPSEACPRGEFRTEPCHPCEQKRAAARRRGEPPAPPKGAKPNRVPQHFRGLSGSISKLHQRWRDALGLDALGFVPEQWVGGYRVDDLHRERRIAVEINGDYVHANPAKYKATDKIVLEFSRYTAAEKWAEDEKRTERLRAAGWRVLIVWESDDVADVKACLDILLRAAA